VIPLVLAAVGLALLGIGALLLRSLGSGFRVGRLLAAAPNVTVADAVAMARAGERRFVRVHGRITSDEEFPDEHDRPLVFRRTRLEVAEGKGWRVVDEERLAVPFGIEERSAFVAIDADALDVGLVVLPREATGTAAEAPGRLPAGIAGSTPVRHRVDQVSAVEQAYAAGVPTAESGGPALTAGLGRPLVLSTLDPAEAARVLGAGHRGRIATAAAALVAGAVCVAAALVLLVVLAMSAPAPASAAEASSTGSPSASPSASGSIVGGGDARSEGEGAGLAGQPLLVAAGVVVLGIAAAVGAATFARVRRDD
jgi:hypothetical protein